MMKNESVKKANGFPFKIFEGHDLDGHSKNQVFEKNEVIPQDMINPERFPLVKSGLVVLYWKSENGEKIIVDFKSDGQLLRPGIEVDSQKTGKLHAICLKDTEMTFIQRNFLCESSSNNKLISDFYYSLLEEELSSTYIQLKLLKEANLEKRYLIFLNEYKHIYNEISDRMIANYLGVHYTTLSRVKAKILESEKHTQVS